MYQPSIAEPFQAELLDIHCGACAVQDQLGQQLRGHWRVHEAVTGEAASAQEALHSGFAQDGMLVGRHLVEARPGARDRQLSKGRTASSSLTLYCCDILVID